MKFQVNCPTKGVTIVTTALSVNINLQTSQFSGQAWIVAYLSNVQS